MTRYRRFEVLWVAHLFVGEIRQADDTEQLPRLRLRRPLLPSKTGHAEKGLGEAGAEARVASDENALNPAGRVPVACSIVAMLWT